ncbi:MAG TPA: AAA family ATPase, partial [Ferruginibacter sp.]|nr:AAA family ATPase [Ferruginibacter sp.]
MLQKLSISNYAIIENLELDFFNGLSIITGETGAGKSIVMGALGLILGQRADSSVLQDTSKKSIIEGEFLATGNKAIQLFLEQNHLDHENTLLLRREIAANGKSRSFINDTPVNLSQLKMLASLLVDLNQQFDTLELGTENFQREVLDALAGNSILLAGLKHKFAQYTGLKQELSSLQAQQETAAKEAGYNQFLFNELNEIALKENELEELD